MKENDFKKVWKLFLTTILVSVVTITVSCEVEPEIYSEVLPSEFFKTQDQINTAVAVAYVPLNDYFDIIEANSEVISDIGTQSLKSDNGWGGASGLLEHEFTSDMFQMNWTWSRASTGISTCNRLLEIISDSPDPSEVAIAELRALRAFYFYNMLQAYGNIPIETGFSDADPSPKQVAPQVAFDFIEKELLESVDKLSTSKGIDTYGKVNKYAGYSILTQLYLNSERITGVSKWSEAASASKVVIDQGGYQLTPGYFANFRAANEGSTENIWVVPYEEGSNCCFGPVLHTYLGSMDKTFDLNWNPWAGYSFQAEFYNSFEDDDLRKGMFIVGQQYTSDAGPGWTDKAGFGYANPKDEYKIENCGEDFNNYAAEFQPLLEAGCNIFISPEYTEIDGRYPKTNGAKWGKWETTSGQGFNSDADFTIYRLAGIMLARAEALWRSDNASAEALVIVNQIRARAGLDALGSLTEDNLYHEIKKELALEGFARPTLLRFGRWEDDWFLKGIGTYQGVQSVNRKKLTRRILPIPLPALQGNPNLVQNPGYN
jgi:hypothetical protein